MNYSQWSQCQNEIRNSETGRRKLNDSPRRRSEASFKSWNMLFFFSFFFSPNKSVHLSFHSLLIANFIAPSFILSPFSLIGFFSSFIEAISVSIDWCKSHRSPLMDNSEWKVQQNSFIQSASTSRRRYSVRLPACPFISHWDVLVSARSYRF